MINNQDFTLGDLVDKIKDPKFKLTFDIYWNNPPNFITLTKINTTEKADDPKLLNNNNAILLKHCFMLMQQPELLIESN